MSHIEGTFRSVDGLDLYYQSWHPSGQAKAVLGLVHGLGSHSSLFKNVVDALLLQDYAVYGFDLRGHGRSPGQRGYISRWAEFRDDFDCFLKLITLQNPCLPYFALGHSLGAIVILEYTLRYGQRIPSILMAPTLKPVGVPPIRLAIGQLLSQAIPRFSLNTGIPKNAGSRDSDIVMAYVNDPLRHTKGTARLVTEFLQTTQWIEEHIHTLQSPILTLHGGDDRVALSKNSRALFEQIQMEDKEYREYAGAYHDLHNDINVKQVIVDITNWLDRHINTELSQCNLNCLELKSS